VSAHILPFGAVQYHVHVWALSGWALFVVVRIDPPLLREKKLVGTHPRQDLQNRIALGVKTTEDRRAVRSISFGDLPEGLDCGPDSFF